MSAEFISIDRDRPQLFPAIVRDYLPEQNLARFVVEIVEQLDLKHLVGAYRGTGSAVYHPKMLVALLFYGDATGVFSSRKLAQAPRDSIAFRLICTNTHLDYRTIAEFWKSFLSELEALFVVILLIGQAMGLVKLGTVNLDGTKIKANASKHKALSWAHANRLQEQLEGEVDELMRLAEQADDQELPEQMDIPLELERREQRLEVIAVAKAEIAARAPERCEREQARNKKKQAKGEAHEKKIGKKTRGKGHKPPTPGPRAKDQVNLTDEESRIMCTSSGGFERGYNAQAVVGIDTHLIVGEHVTQHTNDKQEVAPALKNLATLSEPLGEVEALLADTGYHSEANIDQCESAGIEPLIPAKREGHNQTLPKRFREDPEPMPLPTSLSPDAPRQSQLLDLPLPASLKTVQVGGRNPLILQKRRTCG